MDQPAHTAIPDTSDATYWDIIEDKETRSTRFVPKDKELHKRLKAEAWKAIQATQSKTRRRG